MPGTIRIKGSGETVTVRRGESPPLAVSPDGRLTYGPGPDPTKGLTEFQYEQRIRLRLDRQAERIHAEAQRLRPWEVSR